MSAFATWFWRKPVKASVTVLAVGGTVLWLLASMLAFAQWRVFDARITAAGISHASAAARGASGAPAAAPRTSSWSFRFGETTVTVDVPLDEGVVERTAAVESRRVFRSSGWLRERYITNLVRVQSAQPLIAALATELDHEADALGVTDPDTRLEFYVTAIQAIPYGVVSSEIRLPAEVLASGAGVCSEKSVLLAELLVNRGYDTVLWVLPTQHHVGLGVATTGQGYRGSGYAFIETTRPAWIGECDPIYRAAGPIAHRPVQIALGGTTRYESGAQVEYVLRILDSARRDSESLGPYTIYADAVPPEHTDAYAARAERSQYAYRLASWIEANPDRREQVYELLTQGGSGR